MSAVSSVSSNAPQASRAASNPRPASLDVEKANCERQLADWVHCVSASTPQGKEKIAELSSKLSAINARIEKASKAKPEEVASRPTETLGNHIDVFA